MANRSRSRFPKNRRFFGRPFRWSIVLAVSFIFIIVSSLPGSAKDKEIDKLGTVCGLVTECETNNPLPLVKVSLGETSVFTDATGFYELKNIPTGTQTLSAFLAGYEPFSLQLTIKPGIQQKDIVLFTKGPIITLDDTTAPDIVALEDATVLNPIISLCGNVELMSKPRLNKTKIRKLQILINGKVLDVPISSDGSFYSDISLISGQRRLSGSNAKTLQVRVLDEEGFAGTSRLIKFHQSIPKTDLRIALSWNSEDGEVYLHFIKPGGKFGILESDCHYPGGGRLSLIRPTHELYKACGVKVNGIESGGQAPPVSVKGLEWDWGRKGVKSDNPVLQVAQFGERSSQIITLQKAEPGNYSIVVHCKNNKKPIKVSLEIWTNIGTEKERFQILPTLELKKPDDKYDVCVIKLPQGEIVKSDLSKAAGK